MIDNKYFEWDKNKEIENIKKHYVCFTEARFIFNDPFLLIRYDEKHSFSEDRYQILGRVDRILFAVYALRENKRVRLISARLATKAERRIYYDNGIFNFKAWRQAY